MDKLEGTILADYDTIYFDLDKTIWECYTSQGTSIGAYAMTPPFELKTGVMIKDIEGNFCKLQDGIRTILRLLDERDTNMGVLSSGEAENTASGAQPSVLLLKKFGLHDYFNMGIVCKRGIDKREYAFPFGKTLLIDDDDENLDSVKENELVDILDRKAFEDWGQLLQKKTSNLVLGLYSFLTKRAQKEFDFRSGAKILLDLYKAELDYTPTKRKQGVDEISDEENVRFLQSKSNIPRLFEEAVQYLRTMLNDTIQYSFNRPDEAPSKYIQDLQRVETNFNEALKNLNEASKYIYNEDHWPQIFIVIDNVISLMHADITFIEHILLSDESALSKSYEEHIGADAITFEDKDDFGYHLNKLQEEWDEFKDFLTQQGKSLQFTSEASKLSWQAHLDPANVWDGVVKMPDFFWENIPDKVRWYGDGELSYKELPDDIKTRFDKALLNWEKKWQKRNKENDDYAYNFRKKRKLSWQATSPKVIRYRDPYTKELYKKELLPLGTRVKVTKKIRGGFDLDDDILDYQMIPQGTEGIIKGYEKLSNDLYFYIVQFDGNFLPAQVPITWDANHLPLKVITSLKLSWQVQPEGMPEDQFWQIMGANDTAANIRKRLRTLTPEQLIAFQDRFNILFTKMLPKVQDHWMEASADSLDYSIFSVIHSGKDNYYHVLSHPLHINTEGEYEEISYFAGQIYEEKTGDDGPFWDGIKPYGNLKLSWQFIPEGQNPNLTPQYNMVKKAIEKLDTLDFGGQDLVQDAFYEAKEEFEKIGDNYNLKNMNAIMNLLDKVRQMANMPSFPTPEETRDLNKALRIIDTLIDKL